MIKTIILFGFLILNFFVIFSQNVVIEGISEYYANDTLQLKIYSDFITYTEEEIAYAAVSSDGSFKFDFFVKEATLCFINLNVLKGFLVVEPGKSYEIILPEKILKSVDDELNPYYSPQEFYFTFTKTDENELNYNLKKFDSLYNNALNTIFKNSFSKYKKSKVDSIVAIIDSAFFDFENSYFTYYKEYRYAAIRKAAYMRDKEIATEKYFVDKEILYSNPAYMEFFCDIYDNTFSTASYLIDWDVVKLSLAQKSFYGIDKSLSSNELFNDKDFRHLVIIESLHDLFYSGNGNKENIIAVLDSMQSFAGKENKTIINNFRKEAVSMLENYEVPEFELPDKDGNLVNIHDFEGNFVYLSFYNADSYVCKSQVSLLKKINDYNADLLDVVTIFVGNSPEEMTEFIEEYDCNWTFLYYNKNSQVIKDYKVVVYPTYILVNPEGNLLKYPAPTPEESFETQYNGYYLEWKKELIRKKQESKMLGN